MKIAPNINYLWTSLLIEELIRCGSTHFVVAPGSRSAPLAAAVSNNARAKATIAFDERCAGFFALGHAKATGYAAPIIVTSGTALANLMPAVVEASLDRVPLIILSADRPWELRDVQANQTIYQSDFFGNYVRWFFELPCPDDKTPPQVVLSAASYAAWQSRYPLAGPVHLNCLFREPLSPVEEPYQECEQQLKEWQENNSPFTSYAVSQKSPNSSVLKPLASLLNNAKCGLLVIGALKDKKARSKVLQLGEHLGWPLCVDISSGLRQCDHPLIIRHDHHLWDHPQIKNINFDVVLQLGGRLISKSLEHMLNRRGGQSHILIDNHIKRSDPGLTLTHRIDAHINIFVKKMLTLLMPKDARHPMLRQIMQVSDGVSCTIDKILQEGSQASEPYVAHHISKVIAKDSMIMACTSMPIRDYHMFAVYRSDGGPQVVVNRGASGIDGLISTAIAFAHGAKKRATILIGDLAFMHDANAMALLGQISVPICIVVINNRGGGIFSFLPIAKYPRLLTPFIDAPHDHDLSGLAKAFGIKHTRVQAKAQFEEAYDSAQKSGLHEVIEVMSERESNYYLHERIKTACYNV